jgi:TonB family protein
MIVLATAIYWIALGSLALLGATLVARVLRRRGRAERGVWAAGLGAALLLPPVLPTVGAPAVRAPSAAALPGPAAVIDLAPLRVGVVESADLAWLSPTLLWGWAILSGIMLLRLLVALRVVSDVRRRATPVPEAAGRVRLTAEHGPAVVGFLRPVVLLPTWVMELPAERYRWILRHEEQHIRGRDPWYLALVLISRVTVPWNPAVWALGAGIRTSIETDCDRRTLGREGDPASYAEALLTVARGARAEARLPAMAPAFAERRVSLERRIDAIATPTRRLGIGARGALAAVALLALIAACEVPSPMSASPRMDAVEVPDTPLPSRADLDSTGGEAADDETAAAADDGPRFIPYDRQPVLQNRREVGAALEGEYPPLLKQSGIGGVVNVWLYIDDEGAVSEVEINQGSGYDALDAAALAVARAMRFTPASNRGEPTPVWISIPITFTVGR